MTWKELTASKYDEVIRRLTEMGLRVPDGQLYHVCYGDRQRLQVIDIFESPAKLEAFGAKLMPTLQELGIEAKPTIFEVYNIIGEEPVRNGVPLLPTRQDGTPVTLELVNKLRDEQP